MVGDRPPATPEGPPVPELLGALAEQMTRLLQREIELAKAEMAAKGKQASSGAGAFGIAGLVALLALGAATAAAILGLASAVTAWFAALIVAAAYLLLAGLLVQIGRSKVRKASPPMPEQALQSAQTDAQEIRERAKEGWHEGRVQEATRRS